MRKARAMAAARSNGNNLFKASKFSEACAAYGEGLEHDPCNSVLLCNRAACRSKLGQFKEAVEDCTAALNLRPSYSKARLRRADCNAKVTHLSFLLFTYIMQCILNKEKNFKVFTSGCNLVNIRVRNRNMLTLSCQLCDMCYVYGKLVVEEMGSFDTRL